MLFRWDIPSGDQVRMLQMEAARRGGSAGWDDGQRSNVGSSQVGGGFGRSNRIGRNDRRINRTVGSETWQTLDNADLLVQTKSRRSGRSQSAGRSEAGRRGRRRCVRPRRVASCRWSDRKEINGTLVILGRPRKPSKLVDKEGGLRHTSPGISVRHADLSACGSLQSRRVRC